MSFADEFTPTWGEIIRPAIDEDLSDLGLRAHRVDVTKISGSIITEIMDGIAHARLVLGEISTMSGGNRNANVLYEVGLAHALRQRQEVLLIRNDEDRIPFDVAPIRIHRYWPEDPAKSRILISETIRDCLHEVDLTRSLKVQQAVESLDDACLNLIHQHHEQSSLALGQQSQMGQVLTAIPIRLGVFKLLELGMVRCDADIRQNLYAYHWTPFGKAVLQKLGY